MTIQDNLKIAYNDVIDTDTDILRFEDLSLNRRTHEVHRGQRFIELAIEGVC